MNETLVLILSCVAGAGLGAIFFGGLWWTVRRALASEQPALWFLVSLLLRTGVALLGFFLVGGTHWPRMIACLAGFVAARFVVMALTRASGGNHIESGTEASDAP